MFDNTNNICNKKKYTAKKLLSVVSLLLSKWCKEEQAFLKANTKVMHINIISRVYRKTG